MSDYNTITVSAGDTHSISIGSGETLENTLIDMTADGASAKIYAEGSDWTVRNVAFKGEHPGGHYLFVPSVPDRNASATVENLYMGDGQRPRSGKGAVWVQNSHRGTIDFRKVHIAHFIDNGLYGMDPGYSGAGAVVNVYNSYFDSNNIANIRVGSADGRPCTVDNCVVEADSGRPCGVGCSSPGAVNSRGLWAWWGPVDVIDSDIEGGGIERDGGSINEQNTRWDSNADTDRRPKGVPLTPEAAASGGEEGETGGDGRPTRGDGGHDGGAEAPQGTRFDLVTAEGADVLGYQFTVDGTVEKATAAEPKAESNDSISQSDDGSVMVSGEAGNGYGDGYWVNGDVTALDLKGNADQWTLRWNGSKVSPDEVVTDSGGDSGGEDNESPPDEDAPTHTVILSSPSVTVAKANWYTYTMVVDEVTEKHNIEPHDAFTEMDDGRTKIEGKMLPGGFKDGFTIRGDIHEYTATAGMNVTLDGEPAETPVTTGDEDGPSGGVMPPVEMEADGTSTEFEVPHGLGETPAQVSIEAGSKAASSDFWIQSVDAESITVKYAAAPSAGATLAWYVSAVGGDGGGV